MAVEPYSSGGTYGNCKECGALCVHREHHRCAPIWKVRRDGDGPDEARKIHGRDAEDAASEYCERFDGDLDYSIIRNGGATLLVERDGETVTIHIEAESRPRYAPPSSIRTA